MSQPRVVTRLYSSAESNYRAVRWKFAAVGYFAETRLPLPLPLLGVGGKIAEDKGRKLREILFSRLLFLAVFLRRLSNLLPLIANNSLSSSSFSLPFLEK